ncbi:hypothetical protein ACR9E3_13130 [Actinomycetospora sp. C-140]
MFEGDKPPVVMLALSHTSHHMTAVGDDGYLFPQRIVQVREEGDTVYARTLGHGEYDDGRRVHPIPGGDVTFEDGAVVIELDAIDDFERQDRVGPTPLTPVLWTWLRFCDQSLEARERYVLAAARRHDIALDLLAQVLDDLDELHDAEGAPVRRQLSFRLISRVESLMIALGRLVHMVQWCGRTLPSSSSAQRAIPTLVAAKADALKEIRDAFEHIDERATGRARRQSPAEALTIFDHPRLLTEEAVSYGGRVLTLGDDVPRLLSECRQFFKDVVSD